MYLFGKKSWRNQGKWKCTRRSRSLLYLCSLWMWLHLVPYLCVFRFQSFETIVLIFPPPQFLPLTFQRKCFLLLKPPLEILKLSTVPTSHNWSPLSKWKNPLKPEFSWNVVGVGQYKRPEYGMLIGYPFLYIQVSKSNQCPPRPQTQNWGHCFKMGCLFKKRQSQFVN